MDYSENYWLARGEMPPGAHIDARSGVPPARGASGRDATRASATGTLVPLAMWSSPRDEKLPLLRVARATPGSANALDEGDRVPETPRAGSSAARAWQIAGACAVIGTVAIAGVSGVAPGDALASLGAAATRGEPASFGASESLASATPRGGVVSSSSPLPPAPALGNDKWADFVNTADGPGQDANTETADIGLERDPAEMLREWDAVVKWDPNLKEEQGTTPPGLYDPFDPTIPMITDVDRAASALTWDQARKQGYVMTPEMFKNALFQNPSAFLVIHAVNGLGNRMRALAAGKCLSRERNRKLVIVWERDDSLMAPVSSILTPSFLRGSFILEQLPYNWMTQQHAKLQTWNAGNGDKDDKPVFSLIHDATTEWGKQQVSTEVAADSWSNWKGAVYIKSSHAELQLTAAEYNFVASYMIYFQPSWQVSKMMKTIPLATKSDDQVVSMHIRAGEDAKLSSDLKLEGEAQAEVALVDSYRQQCTVDSFVSVLTQRAPDAVTRGVDVFVAADKPEDVAALRSRLPNNHVYALSRPDYCNYGYNRAREEECMVYAVADLFLLSRNPGPMLRSKFSSFSDFANYYRKRAGRLQGKGFLVNGCADDGNGQDGVLTASLGAAEATEMAVVKEEYRGSVLQKKAYSDKVVTRFAMGVEGGGLYKLREAVLPVPAKVSNAPGESSSASPGASSLGTSERPRATVSLCARTTSANAAAKELCAPEQLAGCPAGPGCEAATKTFYRKVRASLASLENEDDSSLGMSEARKKERGMSERAPYVIELNPLMGSKPAAAAYPTHASSASHPAFPEVGKMAALAESEGVDFTVAALYRDPVEAVARTAALSKNGIVSGQMFDGVLAAFEKQASGYHEMSTQLQGVSRDFYACHSMDDEASVSAAEKKSAAVEDGAKSRRARLGDADAALETSDFEEAAKAVGRWGWGGWNKRDGAVAPRAKKALGVRRALLSVVDAARAAVRATPAPSLEPQVLAAYDAMGADAFYWFSAFSQRMRNKAATDAFSSTLSVAMPDRLDLLARVQKDMGRALNKVEMQRYVEAENAAYAAYFAFRTGVCR